jgi:hypothetical protein
MRWREATAQGTLRLRKGMTTKIASRFVCALYLNSHGPFISLSNAAFSGRRRGRWEYRRNLPRTREALCPRAEHADPVNDQHVYLLQIHPDLTIYILICRARAANTVGRLVGSPHGTSLAKSQAEWIVTP